jgi:hypothetical protein
MTTRLQRRLKTHRFLLICAIEFPVTKVRASGAGGIVDANWKASVVMCNIALVYDTYTNAIGGLEPVRIGWMRQDVARADSSTLM